jgi:integrase
MTNIQINKMSRYDAIRYEDESNLQLIALKSNFEKYIHAAVSDNTRKAYQADLSHFFAWGGTLPSTPEIISQYLASHATTHCPATLNRWLVSINRAHTSQNLPSPTKADIVKATLRGIKRTVGIKQRQVEPVLKNNLLEMVNGLNGIKGTRDRALLLIGFAGAFRRSELINLNYDDIEFVEQGLLINLRKSKTDQIGEGRKIAIPYARGATCPVQALKHWLEISRITDGPLFRPITRHGKIENFALSAHAVAIIVKDRAKTIGLDASKFSGHSLRAGLVTSAAQVGVSTWKIRQQTGHKSDAMLNRYIRNANIFSDNATGAVL